MKINFKIAFLFYLSILLYNSFAQKLLLEPTDSSKTKLIIADIKISPSALGINHNKVEAAINLAAEMSEKFELIPERIKDSLINTSISTDSLNILFLANQLDADLVLFVKVNQLVNMIRVDIASINVKDTTIKSNGIGYSLIHLFDNLTGKPLADPSLLEANQRALASLVNDSTLYSNLPVQIRVFPAPTIVVGGIEFIDDSRLNEMLLFKNKVIVSYDLCESIFEEIAKNPHYICYDLATRDTMYAMANFYYVENYNPPNQMELKILSLFDVEYYITGTYRRVSEGASLELQLCRIENEMLRIIKSIKDVHKNDDIEDLRKLSKQLTSKLLD